MYSYLRGLDADIYLLQEHCQLVNGKIRPISRAAELARAFSDFHLAIKGQLVTLSKLPVIDCPELGEEDLLRVDIRVGEADDVISIYNVHIQVPLLLGNPFAASFYREIRQRHVNRAAHFSELLHDLHMNSNAALVAGDLNASAVMVDSTRLRGVLCDAIYASGRILPWSWNARSRLLRLWRLDWVFLSPQLSVTNYEFLDPGGRSDHRAQRLILQPVISNKGRA